MRIDGDAVRGDFPFFAYAEQESPALVYLDNAATTQRPACVLDAVNDFYICHNANIHRGIHRMAEEATAAYEQARADVCSFINAASVSEIIFTRGTTESINLVACSYAGPILGGGCDILLTQMEHHSNLVPWQMLARHNNLRLRFVPVLPDGCLDMDRLDIELRACPGLLALAHVSNVTGCVNPIREIVALAHHHGVPVLVDGAQAVPHLAVDVRELGCDFYAFSAHKMLGPTGVGVLYGREALLAEMPPFLGGGEMIHAVTLDGFTCNELPHKFEAGTPNIAGVIGFGAALAYLKQIGLDAIRAHLAELTGYAWDALSGVEGVRVPWRLSPECGIVSFYMDEVHPHDVAQVADDLRVAIRAGHMCAQPLITAFDLPSVCRASMYLYNTASDIDRLIEALQAARRYFT
ncbi:MAG: SufS family cysteine desulfurase [Spartobacteria bacterium]|nr:SufS family cysteine desulfurase [Spartobacteria bacterium]